MEFDIDHVTMKKIKEMVADNLPTDYPTELQMLYSLLFEELKVECEFGNLGEALTSTLQIPSSQLPQPAQHLEILKQMNIK